VEDSCEHGNELSDSVKCRKTRVTVQMVASQEGLSSMELITWLVS
jgi:hypothetical protein